MKIIILSVSILLCILSNAFTDSDTNTGKNELMQENKNSKIVIPDIKLSIEDQSRAQLTNNEDNQSNNIDEDFGEIDMKELTKTKISEKIKSEITEERKKEDFSLSAFKFYYGRYENFLAELNAGKKTGNLNYLITYLRNKRASAGFNNTNYFNTELEIDDLDADFIYTFSKNIEFNSTIGYYVRDIGLFTNAGILSENKQNVPVRLGAVYNIDLNSSIKADTGYNYLELNHKIPDGYQPKTLWDYYLDADYEANWSRDNFLKVSGNYTYSIFSNDILQYGQLNAVDKFPLSSIFSIQGGLNFDLYSYKSFFIYPTLLGFYKFSDQLNFKLGLSGEQKNITPDDYRNENQIDYRPVDGPPPFSEEKWTALSGITYLPSQSVTLRCNINYDYYNSFISYTNNTDNGLYSFISITNLGILEADLSADWSPVENLTFKAEYTYRLPSLENMFFFYKQSASLNIDYKYPIWDIEASMRLTYIDKTFYDPVNYFDPEWIWDISLSKSLAKNIYAEIKLNNILNMNYFDRPCMPAGGFTFNAGIRIIL